MKKSPALLITSILLVQALSTPLLAQAPSTLLIGGGNGGAVALGQNGEYDIRQTVNNQSQIIEQSLKQTKEFQEADITYLKEILSQMKVQLNGIVTAKRQFSELSQSNISTEIGTIDLKEYLTLANEINAANEALVNAMETNRLVNRDTLPSYDPLTVGDLTADIKSAGQINMDAVINPLNQIREKLVAEINSIPLRNVKAPSGQILQINGDALDVATQTKGLRLLTPDQRQTYTDEIALLFTPKSDTLKYQNQSVQQTRNLLISLASKYGNSEWLRFTNDNDDKALRELMRDVTEAFWTRSYLRAKYGFRIGAMQTIDYKKSKANLEDFLSLPIRDTFRVFREQGAVLQDDVNTAFENVRNYLELYDKKTTPVLGKKADILASKKGQDYLSQNTNILVRLNSGITYLTGQRQTVEILKSFMILMLADIMEERRLANGDVYGMKTLYDQKYKATDEAKQINALRVCRTDYTLSDRAFDANCKDRTFSDFDGSSVTVKFKAKRPQGAGGQSTVEIFARLSDQFVNVEQVRQKEGQWKQEMMDADTLATMTDEDRARKDATEDDLF